MTKDLVPPWYVPQRDYIVVHSSQKDKMQACEAYTRVVYLDFLEQDKIVFMRGMERNR